MSLGKHLNSFKVNYFEIGNALVGFTKVIFRTSLGTTSYYVEQEDMEFLAWLSFFSFFVFYCGENTRLLLYEKKRELKKANKQENGNVFSS
jgi:hypothetical protein